jgi:hypothetical protein
LVEVEGRGLEVGPADPDTLISEQLENQKGAKSHSQKTVYLPLGRSTGRDTYASVISASWLKGRQLANFRNSLKSGSRLYGAMKIDTHVPEDLAPV